MPYDLTSTARTNRFIRVALVLETGETKIERIAKMTKIEPGTAKRTISGLNDADGCPFKAAEKHNAASRESHARRRERLKLESEGQGLA